MAHVTGTTLMTAEDLWQMPDDGLKHELVRGELRTTEPGGYEHGWLGSRILLRLGAHVEAHDLGDTTTEIGCKLPGYPETVRAPDVAFVSRERIEASGRSRKFFDGAPDLVVEIVSPGDSATEVHEKALDWLAAGVRLVLLVHPRPRTISAYRSASDIRILGDDETLDASDVVDGWLVRVGDLLG